MAITTYSELQTAVANWLNRQDLTSRIPEFIALAEAGFNRSLRVIDMETRDSGTSSDGTVPVPTDWLETRTLRLSSPTNGQQLLEYASEQQWDDLETQGLTGTTRYYTIINGEFQVLPTPSSSVTYIHRYYAKIPALSDSNTTNWLLTKSPDLYLYASLLAAEAYLKDDERLPIWKSIQDEIIDGMMLESERAKRPTASKIVARPRTFG